MDKLQQPTVCKICGGIGFVRRDVPLDHPDFGKAIPCVCKNVETVGSELAIMRKVSGLSHLGMLTFETFRTQWAGLSSVEEKNLQEAYQAVWTYASSGMGWLLIKGSFGTGKTHLAAAIANERLNHAEPVIFVLVPDLLDHLRSTFSPSSVIKYDERFELIRSARFLILDDFGSHTATQWADEKLFQILDHRYIAHLPTVITTNYEMEEIDPRIRSRLEDSEICKIVTINAPDFRQRHNVSNLRGQNRSSQQFLSDLTFDTFNTNYDGLSEIAHESLKKAFNKARRYAEEPHDFIVFIGDYGCGKTHLAAAIANYIEKSEHTLFLTVPDLLDHLRSTFAPNSNISFDRRFSEARSIHYLVLDDLGTENATPWAREKLFQIINHRYITRLPTIITFHSSAKIDERIQVRIRDKGRSEFIEINAPNYRYSESRNYEKQIVLNESRPKRKQGGRF